MLFNKDSWYTDQPILFVVKFSSVKRAEVAQLAEHSPEKAGVDSSILSLGTISRVIPHLNVLNAKRPGSMVNILHIRERRP